MLVSAVLKRQLAESSNHILDGWVLAATVLATKSIQPCDAVEHVVDDGNDDDDTNGVSPDDNDSDDINPTVVTEVSRPSGVSLVWLAGHPTEQSEDGSKSIDTQNGNDQLERGECLAATSNKDQPVLGKGHLKEENGLDSTEVLDDTTVGQKESATDDPSAKGKEKTKDDGDEPDLRQLPFDGTCLRVRILENVSVVLMGRDSSKLTS